MGRNLKTLDRIQDMSIVESFLMHFPASKKSFKNLCSNQKRIFLTLTAVTERYLMYQYQNNENKYFILMMKI